MIFLLFIYCQEQPKINILRVQGWSQTHTIHAAESIALIRADQLVLEISILLLTNGAYKANQR